jgi:hypothetical protein
VQEAQKPRFVIIELKPHPRATIVMCWKNKIEEVSLLERIQKMQAVPVVKPLRIGWLRVSFN